MLVEGIIVLVIAIILYMINTLLPPGARAIAKIIGITLAVIGVVLIILAFVLGAALVSLGSILSLSVPSSFFPS